MCSTTSSRSIRNVHKDPVLKLSKHNKSFGKEGRGVLEYEYLYATLSFFFKKVSNKYVHCIMSSKGIWVLESEGPGCLPCAATYPR